MRHAIHSPKCAAIQDKTQGEAFEHQLNDYKSVIEHKKIELNLHQQPPNQRPKMKGKILPCALYVLTASLT
jgi:hypothetical protein